MDLAITDSRDYGFFQVGLEESRYLDYDDCTREGEVAWCNQLEFASGEELPDLKMKARTIDEARAAKIEAANVFGLLASVVGVGITRVEDGYGLKVNLSEEAKRQLPTEVAGVPVFVEVVGSIRKR